MIDRQGKEITPFNYDKLVYNGGGTFVAEKDTLLGLVDTLGKEITPFIYQQIYAFHSDVIESTGAQINGKKGVIDNKGNVIIPFKYDQAYSFFNGYARVQINDRHYHLDTLGNVVPGSESERHVFSRKKIYTCKKRG